LSAPGSGPVPSLASCLARDSGRAFAKKLESARYYAGIDLGTTNSSVTLVDALALLRGDTDAAVSVLPIRQHTARGVVESPFLASVVAEVEPHGGALALLVAQTSDSVTDPAIRRTAEILIERVTRCLGLEPTGERGEHLRLLPRELAELELRGPANVTGDQERSLYCVVRPGWSLNAHIVVRPLVEAVKP